MNENSDNIFSDDTTDPIVGLPDSDALTSCCLLWLFLLMLLIVIYFYNW